MSAPVDNLIRTRLEGGSFELRSDGEDDGRTMFGHFTVFDRWTEIDNWLEGRFMERIARGAFKRTFRDHRDQIRVMYDHGHDPSIGMKPIASPGLLREDAEGAYHESELFDADYANQLLPALRSNQLGASFRMRITGDEWIEPKRATERNPEKLRERTITEVRLWEYGPVPWGAYPDAGQGVRSGTVRELELLRSDPLYLARFTERVGLGVVEKILAQADGRAAEDTGEADGQPGVDDEEKREVATPRGPSPELLAWIDKRL